MANNLSFTISDLAQQDIESALQYISEELKNGKAARDLYAKIREAFALILQYPAAQPQSSLAIPNNPYNLRKMPIGNYMLYYGITQSEITVLRFIYGGRNIDEKFF